MPLYAALLCSAKLRPMSHAHDSFQLSPIKAMELAASRIPGVVSLAQGIPSFQTPQVIKDFVTEKIQAGLCDKYSLTVGLAELREEISLALVKDGLSYDPESEIIATAGSVEGLTASVMSCTSPGDEVIIPSPTYASYIGSIRMAGCRPVFAPLDEDDNFDFEVEAIAKCIGNATRAILYCSPNNPTGTLYSEEKTRALVELALKHNLFIITDEVYKDFYYTDDRHFTPALIEEARRRVIRVCSFSKAFSMTGWRIGFLHTDRSVAAKILKYHDAMVTCAPVVSQYAGIAALRFGEAALREFQVEFKRRRDFTVSRLDQMSDVLDYQVPKATYFVFPRIKDRIPFARDSYHLAYDILEKVRLATVPGIAFGPSGESHLRISYGKEMSEIEEGLERLQQYFTSAGRKRGLTAAVSASPFQAPFPRLDKPPLRRRILARFLSLCARLYLLKRRPVIVGIAGSRGKTVFKRVLHETLRVKFRTRAGILSYNTEVGLPLSILNLPLPVSGWQKLTFPLRAFGRALFSLEQSRVLILEYGILSEMDASVLSRIAVPDWLVVTGVSHSSPGIEYHSLQAGICGLASRVRAENILWNSEDEVLQKLSSGWKTANALTQTDPAEGTDGEALFGSAALARDAATKLWRALEGQSCQPSA